jgi:hypothetical protein
VLGSQLGYRLAGGDQLTGIVASATLKTIGANLGDVFNQVLLGKPADTAANVSTAFRDVPEEFLANLKSAGLGAISSFLTAQLVNAIGLDGFAGGLANSSAGYAIGQIASNIVEGKALFDGLSAPQLGNVVGGFVGSFLASKLISFDTVGGQLGSAVGATLGGIAVSSLVVGTGASATSRVQLGVFAGPVGAAIGAFAGFILGGLIGSIFGGTPRSGADSVWDRASRTSWLLTSGPERAVRRMLPAVWPLRFRTLSTRCFLQRAVSCSIPKPCRLVTMGCVRNHSFTSRIRPKTAVRSRKRFRARTQPHS